ncbi:MAG: PEGA domain-containing protein [Myxococcales bacterium]|nr:PEGA domain-containing protein [Myxococcales bacterium]
MYRAMSCLCFRWNPSLFACLLGALCVCSWAAVAQAEVTDCVRMLRKEQFAEAVSCMEELYKGNRSAYNLRNLALFYEKAGFSSSRRGSRRLARYYWSRSVRSYRDFLEQSGETLTPEDQQKIKGKLQNFAMLCAFGQVAVRTNVAGARLFLVGYRFREDGYAPTTFRDLVPGNYRLRVVHPDYKTKQIKFKLRARQSLERSVDLEPKPKAKPRKVVLVRRQPTGPRPKGPGLTPFWIALGVTGALGAAAVTTHLLAVNQWEEAGVRSLRPGSGYREMYDQAQGLYVSSVSFYSATGVAAAVAIGMLSWHLILPPPEEVALKVRPPSFEMAKIRGLGKTKQHVLWRGGF